MRKVAAALAVLLVLGATVTACWLLNVWHESHEQAVKMEALRQKAALPSVTDIGGTPHEVAQITSTLPGESATEVTSSEPASAGFPSLVLPSTSRLCRARTSLSFT